MTPYNFITFTFIAALTLTNTYGQGKEDKRIKLLQIKTVFQQINNDKNYRVVTINDSDEFLGHGTDNGGSLQGYYKNDCLKKVVEWVGLSNRVVQNEYYFDQGTLVFVYSTDSRYKSNDSTGDLDYSKFDNIIKGRYYFNNDKLICAILSHKEHEKTKQKDAADFLDSSKEYMKLLNARRKLQGPTNICFMQVISVEPKPKLIANYRRR